MGSRSEARLAGEYPKITPTEAETAKEIIHIQCGNGQPQTVPADPYRHCGRCRKQKKKKNMKKNLR